jgi:hypothetical protein
MTRNEFATLMSYLEAGSGTGRKATTVQCEVFYDLLGNLPFDTVKQAARQSLAESMFPQIPPIGLILKFCGVRPVETASRSLIAYGHAARAVHSVGGYGSIDFSDPLVNAVVRFLGGWNAFTEWPCDSVQWRKRDFIQQYEALEQCGLSGEFCAPLTGLVGTANAAGGFIEKVPEPNTVVVVVTGPLAQVFGLGKFDKLHRILRFAVAEEFEFRFEKRAKFASWNQITLKIADFGVKEHLLAWNEFVTVKFQIVTETRNLVAECHVRQVDGRVFMSWLLWT